MKMNKFINRNMKLLAMAFSVLLVTTACDQVLSTLPENQLSVEQAFNTPAKIQSARNGLYGFSQNINSFGSRWFVYNDMRGVDVIALARFEVEAEYRQTVAGGNVAALWDDCYDVINQCNVFLFYLEQYQDVIAGTPGLYAQYQADARFLRALHHWGLVVYYGVPYVQDGGASLGVILQEEESLDGSDNSAPRSTVAQVYASVIADLQFAQANLPARSASPTDADVYFATQEAATALLSRVYLHMGDWANAQAEAESLIAGAGTSYGLDPNPDDWTGGASGSDFERLFFIQHTVNNNPNTNHYIAGHYGADLGADIAVSSAFLAIPEFTADDRRRTDMLIDSSASDGFFYVNKYFQDVTRDDWMPVIRYAEVLLNAAEAIQEQAGATVSTTALGYLNQVRDRSIVSASSYTAGDFANGGELLDAIRAERRIELAFEGQSGIDMNRWGMDITNKPLATGGTITLGPTDQFRRTWPIPNIEFQYNPGIAGQQNPGY